MATIPALTALDEAGPSPPTERIALKTFLHQHPVVHHLLVEAEAPLRAAFGEGVTLALTAAPAPETPTPPAAPSARPLQSPNPARGQRGDFQKVTITLPMDMLRDLRLLGLARRAHGAKSTGVSELVREAVHDLLERTHDTPAPSTP